VLLGSREAAQRKGQQAVSEMFPACRPKGPNTGAVDAFCVETVLAPDLNPNTSPAKWKALIWRRPSVVNR
jgi:hypothetical protein